MNTRSFVLFLALITVLFLPTFSQGQLHTGQLKCEYRIDPLGIDTPQPRLSWKLLSKSRGEIQTAYQVLVASSREKLNESDADLWNSGKVDSRKSLNIKYRGLKLTSRQKCFWTVRVWGQQNKVSSWSEAAWWEMAFLETKDWSASWINDGKKIPENEIDLYKNDPAPLFRKEFLLERSITAAQLYITGLGYYEAYLNGERVGKSDLDPAWTVFSKRIFYSVTDVKAQIQKGVNCIGVTLGNGWYNPLPLRMWGRLNLREFLTIGRPRFIAQLEIIYSDGTRKTVCSDESWKVTDGPILRNNIYLGEVYDARLEVNDWNLCGVDEKKWRTAALATEPIGRLQVLPLPPIRVTKKIRPRSITQPSPGTFIIDMGQNFAGFVKYRFKAPSGTRIQCRYGELLYADGRLNPMTSVCGQIKGRRTDGEGNETLVGGPGSPDIAWQADTYITRDDGWKEYTPRFTFHAFRYIEISGYPGELSVDQIIGLRMNSDVSEVGHFSCSNEMFNDIQKMSQRTFLSNLFAVQSDCPHRERFGYGGDIVATHESFVYNYDMAAFYAKTVQDWSDSALDGGMLTDTAPFVGIQYCGVGWALAHPLLQLNLYRYYGDRSTLETQYAVSRQWLERVQEQYPDFIVGDGLSDHESLTETPPEQLVTPLYYYSTRVMSKMAEILGHTSEKNEYDKLSRKISAAYQEKFWREDSSSFPPGTQASQSFGLHLGLVPEKSKDEALLFLERSIEEKQGHLTTGILGTPFMLDVLSRSGRADIAYRIVNQKSFPGWGFMLKEGATTLWEHWEFSDDTYSHNHPMFGSVSQWFYNWLGGIQADPRAVGFDKITIRPQIISDLDWVNCSYASVRGRITSNWHKKGDSLFMEVQIPVNATATVYVPVSENSRIFESGTPIEEIMDIQRLHEEKQFVVFRISSGRYLFEIRQD